MEPIDVQRVAEKHNKMFIDETNQQLTMAWYKASLTGIATNDPKKFPKRPAKISDKNDEKEYAMLLAKKIQALKEAALREGEGAK